MAIQVVVRNLNATQEFQIHDAEFAVDVDPTGRHSRFYSGRDKVIVRTFSVAQQNFSRRNLWVHSAQAVGSLLSAIVPVYQGAYATAVGVFTGGALPAFDKLWHDSSTDQLNLLNDTGFSSTTTSRTVVPKSGVTMFVMFIPAKEFEGGWWTQDCANRVYLGSEDANEKILQSGLSSGLTGLDVDKALEPCLESASSTNGSTQTYKVNLAPATDTNTKPVANFDLFKNPQKVAFKDWSGNMFLIFRELSYTVIAGSHTVEASTLKPSLSSLACPKDKEGNVTLDGKETLTCAAKGANLGTVTKIKLYSSGQAGNNQSESAEGTFAPTAGDPTSGSVSFVESTLAGLAGGYKVVLVDSGGIETTTDITLNFPTSASVSSVDPTALDLAKPLPVKFTLKGAGLSNLDSVVLTSSDSKTSDSYKVTAPTADSATFEIDQASKVAQIDATKPMTFKLSLKTSGANPKTIDTTQTITVKGKLPKAAPAKPKVPPVKPKVAPRAPVHR